MKTIEEIKALLTAGIGLTPEVLRDLRDLMANTETKLEILKTIPGPQGPKGNRGPTGYKGPTFTCHSSCFSCGG